MVEETNSPFGFITDFLRDDRSQDQLAVAAEQGNDLATEGFGRDLREMSYAGLVAKYGEEVAQNRFRYQDGVDRLAEHRDDSSTLFQKAGDTALDAAAGLVSISGNTVGALAVRPLAKLAGVDPDVASAVNAELTAAVSRDIRSGRSDFATENSRYQGIASELDADDSTREYVRDLEEGATPFTAGLQRVGRDILNAGSRIGQDPEAIREIISGSLGSLGPSAALARGAAFAATKGVTALTASTRAATIASTASAAAAIGATEASGTYADVLNEVMEYDADILSASPVYAGLLEEGYTPSEARVQLANLTAEAAFADNLPAAIALGVLTQRFETAPIGSFKGAGVVGGMRTIGLQGAEEAGQGAAATLSANAAIAENVDETRSLSEGVGDAITEGFIGGIGQAGATAIPATAVGATQAAIDGIVAATTPTNYNDPLREALVGGSPLSRAASLTDDVVTDAAVATGRGVAATGRAVATGAKTVATAVDNALPDTPEYNDPLRQEIVGQESKITKATRLLVSPLVDRAAGTDRTAINEATTQAQETVDAVETALDEGTLSTEMEQAVTAPDETPVPNAFLSVANEGESFMGRVARVTQTLADKRTKITDSDAAFAGAQFAKLRGMIPSMPAAVRSKAVQMLQSPQAKAVEKRLKSIDQNTTPVPTKITRNVVSETVSVAKTNPANVNPDNVKKILEQSGEDISAEDTRLLQSAARIASIVNDRQGKEVAIAESKQIGLSKKSGKPVVVSKSIEETSRSFRVKGYTKADGKTPLRSLNDFAADVFVAAQSPERTMLNEEGTPVPATVIMEQLGKLVTHMNNKVGALNESFNRNNEKGTGPSLGFEGLVGADKFVPADRYSGKVAYHRGNPNSVAFAQQVAADQDAAVQVYNELRTAFPDQFGSLPEVVSTPLLEAETAPVLDEVVDAEAATTEEGTTPEELETADLEVTDLDSNVDIDQGSDTIVDDDGNPIKFYHGASADFTEFRDGGIFLTTRKGLAREHARRGEGGTPRLIETEVALSNPLTEQIPNDEDPDAFWLKNSLTLETAKQNGGYNAIFLFNDNEGMVIADTNDQVTITNPDFDGTRETADQEINLEQLQEVSDEKPPVHEAFETSYQEETDTNAPKTFDAYLESAKSSTTMNLNTVAFAEKLVRPMVRALNTRLKKVTVNGQPLLEALKDDTVQTYKQYRNTVIVNKETGEYDQDLIELAGVAMIDWMASVQAHDPNQLDDTLEELGISMTDITAEQMEGVLFGVSVNQAKATIAQDILRMWGRRENVDAPLAHTVGIAEGIAAEMITVIANNPNLSLLEIQDLPLGVKDGKPQVTQTIIVKGLEHVQDQIKNVQGEDTNMLAREELFDVPKETYSIGSKISGVPVNQARGSVRLSQVERTAVGNIQDIPSFKNEINTDVVMSLGETALERILGYTEGEELIENATYRRSVEGKNLSIKKNIKDTFRLLNQLKDNETPVYFPVGITKVGRHQMQGPNPQSNKLMRALVAPTWSEIDLTNQDDIDAFWLGIAQAADLLKIEKLDHADVLNQVKDLFNKEYREAVDLVKTFHESSEIDGEAFADAVGVVEPQVLSAIMAVADMESHIASGADIFRTSLSIELDGLTNGAANMMVNMGQGEVTKDDFHNFNRVGLFLGQVGKTVNQYFSARGPKGQRNLDMYEKTSGEAQSNMFANLSRMKPAQREYMLAAGRFAARFGNFQLDEKTGEIHMTRNTAKNPMTKVNYGSSVGGVGRGVADDMLIKFYEKTQGIPGDVDFDTYFAYPGMQNDIRILFGDTLPENLQGGAFEFPQSAVEKFQKGISDTLGEVLTGTTKNIIGDKITELNDELVFSTNVQANYVQMIFREKLEALAERRAEEGKLRRHPKTQKPIITELSRRDYNSVVKELEALSPIFVSDDQTLAVGGFQKKKGDFELSAAMNGKLNQKSNLPMPEDVGVAAIPYTVIGTGDAMMMNFVFGSEGAPTDALPVFDGLDVPITKLKEYGPYVNQQVQKTWERDVLAMATANFNGFISQADPKVLEAAFQATKDANKKTTVTAASAKELAAKLDERHRQNAARKAVFKRISLSVDQMGGSDNGFTRGEEEMTLIQINREIEKELSGKKQKAEETVTVEVQESTADAVLKSLRMGPEQKKVAEILRPLMKETRVIIGSVDQMNQYRQDNFPDDGQVLKASANYDAANNTIFVATTKVEPILHEMVHAATFNKVLAHYEGTATNDAVTRMEALMEEFLALDADGSRIREAKAAILRQRAQNDADSKAASVNEFMAYALTNQEVSSKLRDTNTKTLVVISRKVIALMRRLMGGVPATMFDNVVFNTKVLNETPVDDIADNGGNNGNGTDETGADDNGREFTNFWIKTITDYITETFEGNRKGLRSTLPVRGLDADATQVLDGFRQVGLVPSGEQQATFRAIYMVIRSTIQLEPTSVIGLTKILKHIEDTMTPDMFGNDREAPHIYSAVVNSFEGIEAVATLLALSQTSKRFRDVLAQIPDPQGEAQVNGSLSNIMGQFSQMLMSKVMGLVDFSNKDTQAIMDELANGIVALDTRREYAALHAVTGSLTKADKYVSGKMSQLSDKVLKKNEQVKRESRNKTAKALLNTVTVATNLLDKTNTELTADMAKRATHMNVPFLSLVPIREMVSEIVGTDAVNKKLVALQDVVNNKISGMRQAYREDLPVILQDLFKRHPEKEEWAAMHTTLGQTDFTKFINPRRMQQGMQMLEEGARRQARIQDLEQALDANLLPYIAQDAKDKAQQLANYMNGHGAGKLLMRNAYAIVKNLDGNFEPEMVDVVDELVTMYVIDQMDSEVRNATVQLWQEDPKAVTGMVTYIQGLNEAEDAKVGISEQAKLNAYKGFIPNHGDKDTRIIIDTDDNQNKLEKLGYTKLGAYTGDVDSAFDRSYYVTTTRQGGAYSQGIMQNVQSTYRGVDINTGLTVTGETSGFVSGDGQVERYVDLLNRQDHVQEDDKETMMPVFDEDGTVLGFERAINPDVLATHMNPEQNLALMLGAWAGRHVEEGLAAEYNRALLDELDSIYQNREPGTDALFVNLKETNDPIYKEAFSLWPQSSKLYADGLFDGNGPMVRKDQVNLSTGYREFSMADFWSGKTRLPDDLQKTARNVSTLVLGTKALKILSTGEKILQGAVSTAKDIIVIRSLVVPLANTVSNVIQLGTRGVPTKSVVNGYRKKLAEIEEYNKNVTELIELEAKLRLAANNANQRRIIQSKIQVIHDLNAKMTIAPIIEAGAYKNLSEGITELDASITKGKFGDIMESLADRLPGRLTDVAHLGLVSKSTDLYKFANRATQYGDFLAKSIYYDHLMSQDIDGLTHDEAIAKMNEEFVNFSALPGRVRSGLESFGLSWFMAFKIRIAKIAAQQLRENPVRAMAVSNLLPDIGSPVNDNIGQVIWEDRLDYATGYDMLFDAPGLNPWVNLLSD